MLETDKVNAYERCQGYVRIGARQFRQRMADRWPRAAAYSEALAYIRRKTYWGAPLASAALDAELRDQPNQE